MGGWVGGWVGGMSICASERRATRGGLVWEVGGWVGESISGSSCLYMSRDRGVGGWVGGTCMPYSLNINLRRP